MLKYASKLFLNNLISVLARVVGSYMANQHVAPRYVANAPIARGSGAPGTGIPRIQAHKPFHCDPTISSRRCGVEPLEEADSGFLAFDTSNEFRGLHSYQLDSIYAAGLLLGYETNYPIVLDHAVSCDAS